MAVYSHVQRSRFWFVFVVESVQNDFQTLVIWDGSNFGYLTLPPNMDCPLKFEPIWRCTVSSLVASLGGDMKNGYVAVPWVDQGEDA